MSTDVDAALTEEDWRPLIEKHLGPQRMSQYMRRDVDMMARGALIGAAIRAEAGTRLAGDERTEYDQEMHFLHERDGSDGR